MYQEKLSFPDLEGNQKKRLICFGFPRWKQFNIKPLLLKSFSSVFFLRSTKDARSLNLNERDILAYWGVNIPIELTELAHSSKSKLCRMEDGFIRSVGLGSDLIAPMSLVLDERGIYFDPTRPSDLEIYLKTTITNNEDIIRAKRIVELITQHGITKYNIESRKKASWPAMGRLIIVVPGQVEDDASIKFGCIDIRTNLELLQTVRQSNPDAFIVYKPHPDVMSRNRRDQLNLAMASQIADYIETKLSIISCIDACDEIHTMTSLSGFDAILRGKKVVTYGLPFYVGWGLTIDKAVGPIADNCWVRRTRTLSLYEFASISLLKYPLYWDYLSNTPTTCEVAIANIIKIRNKLESSNKLEHLKNGFFRRLFRKIKILLHSFVMMNLFWINNNDKL